MCPKSSLEIDRASCVSLWLLLLLSVVVVVLLSWGWWRDGEVASVYNIIHVTLAWHGTLLPVPCLAVAIGHNCCAGVEFFMMLPKNLLIVNRDDALHVLHGPITYFDGVFVAHFVQLVVAGEAFLQNPKEACPNIGLHI